MANTKISALPGAAALTGAEVLPAVQSGATVGATVQQVVTAATGATGMNGASVAASTPLANYAQTWNNAGVNFTGWKLNVTNTASGGSSLLMDVQLGGSSLFKVDKDGVAYASVAFSTQVYIGSGGFRVDFSGIQTGSAGFFAWRSGTTSGSTDTALMRKAAGVPELNNGTAGTYAGTALLLGIQTVAQLPAAAAGLKGARATVSDATASTFMSTVTGGGSTIVPVFCNGTAWLIG